MKYGIISKFAKLNEKVRRKSYVRQKIGTPDVEKCAELWRMTIWNKIFNVRFPETKIGVSSI